MTGTDRRSRAFRRAVRRGTDGTFAGPGALAGMVSWPAITLREVNEGDEAKPHPFVGFDCAVAGPDTILRSLLLVVTLLGEGLVQCKSHECRRAVSPSVISSYRDKASLQHCLIEVAQAECGCDIPIQTAVIGLRLNSDAKLRCPTWESSGRRWASRIPKYARRFAKSPT